MKFAMDNLRKNSIILRRNREEESNHNYTKIYDLSKIDNIENINFDEKKNLLIAIKKILLSTNEYILSNNIVEIARYILLSIAIFLSFIILYCPFYKSYFLHAEKENNSINESSFFQKLYCYFFFEIIEIFFRIIFNNIKTKRVKKVMKAYANNIIYQLQKDINFNLYIDNNFNIYIIRKSIFNNSVKINEEKKKPLLNLEQNNFFQYVINYPNVRYYNWDRKILNEKENEIANKILQTIKLAEKEHVKKFGFSLILVWIFYFLSFNCLIKGKKIKSLFFRLINFVFTKIISLYMSHSFKNNLMEKEENLSKEFINQGYFILLSFTVIQIFKLNNGYVDNTLNINEIYKIINKDVVNFNEKILEKNNNEI